MLYGLGHLHEDEEKRDQDQNHGEQNEEGVPNSAMRFTCQSRSDFYVIDEEALITHNLRRAAELGLDWDRQHVIENGAFDCFTYLWGLEQVDLTGAGLAPAGSQTTTHEIERTLWEMRATDLELSADAFPTST